MKKLSYTDQFIKDNLASYEEYYMIATNQETGLTNYYVITNLYYDPYYFVNLNGDYTKGFHLPVNSRRFFHLFNKYNTVFVKTDNSLGFDRVIYKRVNKIRIPQHESQTAKRIKPVSL